LVFSPTDLIISQFKTTPIMVLYSTYFLSFLIPVFCLGLCVYGIMQLIKLLREVRIINSMMLKTLLKICEKEGIEIDINKIQKEVEDSL